MLKSDQASLGTEYTCLTFFIGSSGCVTQGEEGYSNARRWMRARVAAHHRALICPAASAAGTSYIGGLNHLAPENHQRRLVRGASGRPRVACTCQRRDQMPARALTEIPCHSIQTPRTLRGKFRACSQTRRESPAAWGSSCVLPTYPEQRHGTPHGMSARTDTAGDSMSEGSLWTGWQDLGVKRESSGRSARTRPPMASAAIQYVTVISVMRRS